jgi:hypothetical protein
MPDQQFPDPPLPPGLTSRDVADLPLMARTAMDEWWDQYATIFDHWLDLYRQHRAECDGPPWCTDRLLDGHIVAAPQGDLQALIYVALSRLA